MLENGGIINKLGTFTIALCAKAHKKPMYVFAESLKFMKEYPLSSSDVEFMIPKMEDHPCDLSADYTPPEYVTSLITDLGIFPPT